MDRLAIAAVLLPLLSCPPAVRAAGTAPEGAKPAPKQAQAAKPAAFPAIGKGKVTPEAARAAGTAEFPRISPPRESAPSLTLKGPAQPVSLKNGPLVEFGTNMAEATKFCFLRGLQESMEETGRKKDRDEARGMRERLLDELRGALAAAASSLSELPDLAQRARRIEALRAKVGRLPTNKLVAAIQDEMTAAAEAAREHMGEEAAFRMNCAFWATFVFNNYVVIKGLWQHEELRLKLLENVESLVAAARLLRDGFREYAPDSAGDFRDLMASMRTPPDDMTQADLDSMLGKLRSLREALF